MEYGYLSEWNNVFASSLQNLWLAFIDFVPEVVMAIIVFALGWFVASLLAQFVENVFHILKVDKLLTSAGVGELLKRGNIRLNSGRFFGELVKWFFIVFVFILALNIVGLTAVVDFLNEDVLGFLKNVILSVFILIIATIIADAVSKSVVVGAKAMNIGSAGLIGVVVKYSIWVFAFLEVINRLSVATIFVNFLGTLLIGVIAMLSLAGGLAFGLGGKEAAARLIAKLGEEVNKKDNNIS